MIALTPHGETTLASAMPMWRRSQQRLEGALSSERVELLRGLLNELDALR